MGQCHGFISFNGLPCAINLFFTLSHSGAGQARPQGFAPYCLEGWRRIPCCPARVTESRAVGLHPPHPFGASSRSAARIRAGVSVSAPESAAAAAVATACAASDGP